MNNKIKKIISALVISCTIVGQVAVPTVTDAYTKSSTAKTTYSTKATSVSKAKSVSKIKSQINSTYRKAKYQEEVISHINVLYMFILNLEH